MGLKPAPQSLRLPPVFVFTFATLTKRIIDNPMRFVAHCEMPFRAFYPSRLWFFRLPGFVFSRCRSRLAWAFRDLLLFPLLPHGVFDRFKALVRDGVLLCPAQAQMLPQLFQRGFGIWILLWHNQETSDLASSKHRPIFILTLS